MANTGWNSVIGFGEESTWGTAVSLTNWLPVRSVTANVKKSYSKVPNLGYGTDAGLARKNFEVQEMADPSFEINASYDDSTLLLLKHALGGVSTTGSGPYTHTFTLSRSLPTGLTIGFNQGQDENGASISKTVEGCRINTLSLSIAPGQVMSMSVATIGQTSDGGSTALSPTYSSGGEEILHYHSGQLSFNSANYTLNSFSMELNNNLGRRDLLGSSATQQPTFAGMREVTFQVEIEYLSDVLFTAHHAQTQSDAVISFTGTGNNAATVTLHNAEIIDFGVPVTSEGIVTQSLTFSGLSDGTDQGLAIAITNDNASATAN